jgi:hypothetical protein
VSSALTGPGPILDGSGAEAPISGSDADARDDDPRTLVLAARDCADGTVPAPQPSG